MRYWIFILVLLVTSCGRPKERPPVRVAVIGGMLSSGLWPEIAARFEAQSGYKVKLVAAGPRETLVVPFREGKIDLLTMHSGDIATDLVADGCGVNMRPWTRNEFVILGPPTDPAKIRGLKDGAEALTRIAQTQSPFVDFQNIGTRELTHNLWKKAGVNPQGAWLLKDESRYSEEVTAFARSKQAYVVLGRIPILTGKMQPEGLEILVEGDPVMRRSFVVIEANPKRVRSANVAGARALSDFLLSPAIQEFLLQFGTNSPGRRPLFFPVVR